MKISKSKQELASIISENGGWRDGAKWAIQHGTERVAFTKSESKPSWEKINGCWGGCIFFGGFTYPKIANYHQASLSNEEYFHLYPAPDADGWIAHDGLVMPASANDAVEVKTRGGRVGKCLLAKFYHWIHAGDNSGGDITHYRMHKPGKAKPEWYSEKSVHGSWA